MLVAHQTQSPLKVERLENTYYFNPGVPVAVGERYSEYEILYSGPVSVLVYRTINTKFVIKRLDLSRVHLLITPIVIFDGATQTQH